MSMLPGCRRSEPGGARDEVAPVSDSGGAHVTYDARLASGLRLGRLVSAHRARPDPGSLSEIRTLLDWQCHEWERPRMEVAAFADARFARARSIFCDHATLDTGENLVFEGGTWSYRR
ncbi:MAG: hypothetical protein WKG01_07810 [Kofleriaceae bacterium]